MATDFDIMNQTSDPKSSNKQHQATAGMTLDQQTFGALEQRGTRGFNNPVLKVPQEIDLNGAVTEALGGKINAFEGLRECNVSPKLSGSAMTAPAINQTNTFGFAGEQSKGQS